MSARVGALAFNLVILGVAAHSVFLGVRLLSFPTWTLKVVGWEYSGDIFWPSQAGLFLVILGSAYAAAARWRPLVWLLIGSKAGAVVFLVAHAIWLDAPRLVWWLAAGDGLMGLATASLFASVQRAQRSPNQGTPRN